MAEIKTEQKPGTVDWMTEFQRWSQPFSSDTRAMVGPTSELGGEMMEFMRTRLMRNVETMRALTQCHDLSKVMELQQQWFRNAFEDYANTTNRMIAGCFGVKPEKPGPSPAGKT